MSKLRPSMSELADAIDRTASEGLCAWPSFDADDADRCVVMLADHLRSLLAAHEAEIIARAKREILWLSHGCPVTALYSDDGEMQCHRCQVDFKRAPMDLLMRLQRDGVTRATREQMEADCRAVCRFCAANIYATYAKAHPEGSNA